MTEIRHLTILGRYGYDSIPTITQFVAEAASASQLDEDAIFHCQMSVDEACTNVIEHAYGEEATGNIEITCHVSPGRCAIKIVDQGKPFDPALVPLPKITNNLDEVRPGGIGLHLMRKLMDEVHFEFLDGKNILTMVKTGTLSQDATQSNLPVVNIETGIHIVAPSGRIDATNMSPLEETLNNLTSTSSPWLIVDLRLVTYISSRGLKALVSAWRHARDASGDVVLCSINPQVMGIFETVGFNQIFDIYPDQEKAVKAVSSHQQANK